MTRRDRGGWLLVPNWLWAGLFFLVPLGFIVVFSLGRRGTYGGIRFGLSLDSYREVLTPLFLETFARSFAMSLVATLGCLLVGYPLAYFLAFRAGRWRVLLLVLLVVPFWTSQLVRSYAWTILLSEQGPVNDVLRALGLPELRILFRWPAVVIGLVYSYLPLMVLPLFVVLDRVDRELLHAARDLGATSGRAFRRVTLRLSVPGIVAGTLLVGVPATGEFLVPELLGGGRELMVGNLISNTFIASQNWPLGSAVGVVLTLALLAFVALYLRSPSLRRSQEATI